MVQSRDTTVDYTIKGIPYMGLPAYEKIMAGNRAFGFYNDCNVRDYIQILWDEADTIVASTLFKGKKISRFVIMTKSSGIFSFSSRDNKALLRAVANYIDGERMVRSPSSLDVIKRSIRRTVHRKREDPISCRYSVLTKRVSTEMLTPFFSIWVHVNSKEIQA